ncbi:hypothetical protein HZA44_00755, partial [Candidatus Peregrinibacteria bacterium]|nr:hypothetical protein [Candidatus Peregrinibacteria bacterium]
VFSGFSLGEADLLRRAIGKKIASELEAQKEKFIDGAVKNGFKRDLAVMIFEKVVEPFAGYGFNKSHAACYAMIAYETAYLKAHYPTEFMTALLSADYGNTDRIVIEIGESGQMGINVLPPDVNESLSKFTYVEDGKIRFGLSAIKGLGDESVRVIIEAREKEGKFKSIEDFARRVPAKVLNKKSIEALAYCGAMDSLGERKRIGLNYDLVAEFGKKSESSHIEGQAGLFDHIADTTPIEHLKLPEVEPATPSERLKWEKDYLGLYVSAHPLAGLKKYFHKKLIPLDQLPSKTVGRPIKVGGLITAFRKITTKKGDAMAMLSIEDAFGKAEAVMFPKTFAECGGTLAEDQIIFVEGILEKRGSDLQIIINKATPVALEKLQEVAKREGLWTEGETIDRVSRHEAEDLEIEKAEEVMNVDEKKVKPIAKNAKETGDLHTILVNREVGKAFFVELKKLLEQHPGKQKIQLQIGEKLVPVPMTVELTSELLEEVENMMR